MRGGRDKGEKWEETSLGDIQVLTREEIIAKTSPVPGSQERGKSKAIVLVLRKLRQDEPKGGKQKGTQFRRRGSGKGKKTPRHDCRI